ncbi:MAG: hypothetical protein M0R77_12295 [Gammaproteobacteria bacterium]|nr:hypothetical protein [Gammaproteobacteria bacterium]
MASVIAGSDISSVICVCGVSKSPLASSSVAAAPDTVIASMRNPLKSWAVPVSTADQCGKLCTASCKAVSTVAWSNMSS